MEVKFTERERATVLAALRRWLSYPAAREADSIATNRGKHKPLDDGEIQRLCKRISEIASKGSQRHCVIQTMVPAYRNIQNCGMINLMRAISTNAGEALGDNAYNSV